MFTQGKEATSRINVLLPIRDWAKWYVVCGERNFLKLMEQVRYHCDQILESFTILYMYRLLPKEIV